MDEASAENLNSSDALNCVAVSTDTSNDAPENYDQPIPVSRGDDSGPSPDVTPSPKGKENPFNRFSESESNDVAPCQTDEMAKEDVPEVEDVDLSTPEPLDPVKNEEKVSPMVVSVGTIEVDGSQQYEDINIMSKGHTVKAESDQVDQSPNNSRSEDYESLRDIRFSSISIYDKPHFEEDIIITVDDAQKHAAESFVSYKVVTKTTREAFQQQEFHVRRRYQDFHWLANILSQQYPSYIIPPLPQKKMFNRYDPNFLRLRQLALNKFLRRIAEHPILSTSEHFFTFLSAKQVELIEQKKSTSVKRFSIPQIPISDILDSPFTATNEYCEEFGKVLSSLSSHSTKLHREQCELTQVLRTLAPSLALWANSESDLEPILAKMSECVTKSSDAIDALVETKEEIFTESIKEYQLYVDLIKKMLKYRDHMQVTKEYFTDTVLAKQHELDKVELAEPGKSFATFFGKSPAAVKEEKIQKLKKDISTLSADGESAGDELVVANASIRSDIERWKINKENDCRELFTSLADSHITCYKEAASNWQSIINFIDELETPN